MESVPRAIPSHSRKRPHYLRMATPYMPDAIMGAILSKRSTIKMLLLITDG
jgi:hypothetical protein